MLNSISTLIQKKGKQYVERILSEEVIITEKLDTFRILFEKVDGEIKFFKKDNSPITLVERTLNDIWESALLEVGMLIGDNKIPEGIRFGIAYTPIERPLRLPYTNLPKYILTDITKRENNKVVETYDYDEITQWAGILCMGRPPIIFKGVLTEEQKKSLIDYDTQQYDDFKYNSFSELISKSFKESYSKEEIIEGIVIKSKKNLVQVLSYEFNLLNESYKKENSSRDFYDIVLLSLTEFINEYEFPDIQSDTLSEMYIEIVSDIFVKYCETKQIFEGLEPKYLTSPQHNNVGELNRKFIKNKKALEFIDEDPIYESLYRVILSSFRKYKKPYGLLSESVVDKFNKFVSRISDITDEEKSSIHESLNESRSNNITVKTLKRRQPNDIDNMRVISSVQNAFLPNPKPIQQGDQRVAIYLTECVPFTNDQMNNINQIHSQWNVPIILAAVSIEKDIKGSNFHLSDDVVKSQMRSLSNFNKNLIPSFMMLDSWSLKEIFQFVRPHYEPLLIFTDKGKESDLSLQLFYEEEIMGGRLNVLPEFNIGAMDNKDKLPALRSIEDGNGSLFMEITPKAIHNFYDNIINEYRTWEGSIITQFEPVVFPETNRKINP